MNDIWIHILNDDKQNYRLHRLQLLVVKFGHNYCLLPNKEDFLKSTQKFDSTENIMW